MRKVLFTEIEKTINRQITLEEQQRKERITKQVSNLAHLLDIEIITKSEF